MILSQQIRHLNWKGPHFRSRNEFLEKFMVGRPLCTGGYISVALPSVVITLSSRQVHLLSCAKLLWTGTLSTAVETRGIVTVIREVP